MIASNLNNLVDRLNDGPAVLFLGQAYLRKETGTDHLLRDTLRKFSNLSDFSERVSYNDIIDLVKVGQEESFLSWIAQRSERLSIPAWLEIISRFPWSHVYTSSIDTLWYRAFQSINWRSMYPIFSEKQNPIDPRDRYHLRSTFLFGSITRPIEELKERPPLTKIEFKKRSQEAIALARRIPEILTPFGSLLIEGYDPENDWFNFEDFFAPLIDDLTENQVHLFNYDEQKIYSQFLSDYIEKGIIKPYSCDLASFISLNSEEGRLKYSNVEFDSVDGRKYIRIGNKPVIVPYEVENEVSRTAIIIDESVFNFHKKVSKDREYQDFRNFLSESTMHPVWEGYEREFNISRDFEENLFNAVINQTHTKNLSNEPIILYGQSGTGKSIALGSLAYKIYKEGKFPVLFIERRPQSPIPASIDYFCKWTEDNSADYTIVIWDGMVDTNQYSQLLRGLISRGRKVILIGSTYSSEIDFNSKKNKTFLIKAPSALSEDELVKLFKLLSRFDTKIDIMNFKSHEFDQYFLVALYRLLPPSRHSLRANLFREYLLAEDNISKLAKNMISKSESSFCFALLNAGIITEEDISLMNSETIDDEEISRIQLLTALIMIPGKFGLYVPLELLIRSLSVKWMDNLIDILNSQDIFKWYEDNTGNILIGPRHPYEAKLISQMRYGSIKNELFYVKKLLLEVKHDSSIDSSEVQFTVDLIRAMGPNGQQKDLYKNHYLEISGILTELREKRGVENPRLMLQEASLLRESVKEAKNQLPEEISLTLKKAQDILINALSITNTDDKFNILRSNIMVELGTSYAYQISSETKTGFGSILPKSFFEANEYLNHAIQMNAEDFHPYDVIFWMTSDLLKSGKLSKVQEAEFRVTLIDLLNNVDPNDFDYFQREHYLLRLYELGELNKNFYLSDQAFNELKTIGSKAGYFLRAIRMTEGISFDVPLEEGQLKNIKKALDYLLKNQEYIADDPKCLNLLFKLWWFSRTSKPVFYNERQSLSFTSQDWEFLISIVNKIILINPENPYLNLQFIQAIGEFHLGNISRSLQLFRDLERKAEAIHGKKRIIRHFLVSSSEGNPVLFHGTIYRINQQRNRGEVYIGELRERITFIPTDFVRGKELTVNDPIGPFHIAFNFIAPIADPITYLKPTKI